jgi:hypothetical protein
MIMKCGRGEGRKGKVEFGVGALAYARAFEGERGEKRRTPSLTLGSLRGGRGGWERLREEGAGWTPVLPEEGKR